MTSNSTAPRLPDPNRYITDNNAEGKSVFKAIPPALPVANDLGGALFRVGYFTTQPPVLLTDGADIKVYEDSMQNPPPLVTPGGGATVWYIDTPPGSVSPMHRTVSLDFVVQLEGEMELSMDTGEKRIVKPGDLTIQRSTMHAWKNPSTTRWSRMLGVLSECQPVVVGNQTLGTEFPEP